MEKEEMPVKQIETFLFIGDEKRTKELLENANLTNFKDLQMLLKKFIVTTIHNLI